MISLWNDCEGCVKFFIKIARWRSSPVLKMIFFAHIVQEFSLDFKQQWIPFWNFENNFFTESLSVTAYDSSARVFQWSV